MPRMFVVFCSTLLFCVTSADSDVIFASVREDQNLATRIGCQLEDIEHFEYGSEVKLWDSMGGSILVQADIRLHCLGADENGKYGSDALKYKVQIANLWMTEEKEMNEEFLRKKRTKRGAKDFFQNSWNKVKKFFNKLFGRKTPDETTRSGHGSPQKPTEEEIEVFSVSDLSHLYSTPFQIVQLANGSIPEIRFSENEVEDERVRNFKRHLADAFATHLDLGTPRKRLENSVIGEHTCNYNITHVPGEKATLNMAGWSSTAVPDDSPVVVVKKVVTEEDIVKLSPSNALNDRDGMDLQARQTQVFKDGRMLSSSGTSSLRLVADDKTSGRSRRKRANDDEEDATSYIRAHTTFDIQLRRRRRRSADELDHLRQEDGSFYPASRTAQVEDGAEQRRKLRDLQNSVDLKMILRDLTQGIRNEDLWSLYEIVEREVNLKLDTEENSLSNAVRSTFTLQNIENLCSRNFTMCKDYLQLIALAGGDSAEKIFLNLLQNTGKRFSTMEVQGVADVMSDLSRPSGDLMLNLAAMLEEEYKEDDVTTGTLALCISNLAAKSSADIKHKVSAVFSGLLLLNKNCHDNSILIDLLEAVGNLNSDSIVKDVLQVSSQCKDEGSIRIATAHALRHSCHLPEVQAWIEEVVQEGDCDAVKEVVASLRDKVQDQEMAADSTSWPRSHFQKTDELLQSHLERDDCPTEDILLYFSKKRDPGANRIARTRFGSGSEPWEPESNSRQKRRAPWDNLNCNEWTEDTRYTPIQSKDEFDTDRGLFNKRKSCLAFRKLGVKGANAEIYAGMFAGVKEPSDPPKYKLFTKFVSGLNFLGNQVEIGSFYFYLHSGKTKAYVRIMGQTRQEFTNEGCTPTELRYRPLKHIPLYMVSLANLQLSLGVHLSNRLSVDTACPTSDTYRMQPQTDVRVGGEAMGTVLFVRGALNLGGNFNYQLQFTFTPYPSMCINGSHGYDPMNINVESYYQLWNSAKEEWGKTRVWKPNFLSWQLRKGKLKQWFDDTCIVGGDNTAPPAGLERELE